MMMMNVLVILLLFVTTTATTTTTHGTSPSFPKELVQNVTEYFLQTLERLRGEDDRLFRWDATVPTKQVQIVVCENAMDRASFALLEKSTTTPLLLPLEIFSWCLTDQPRFREQFSEFPQLFEIIHNLLLEPNTSSTKETAIVSAMAAQVIYRAVYGNAYNHAMFQSTIPALAEIVLQYNNASPLSVMWAAAALQNLAANYCQKHTVCHYDWNDDDDDVDDTLQLAALRFNGKLLVNGTVARQTMMKIPNLVETLIQLACQGPVQGSSNETHNPFIGENAKQPPILQTLLLNNHNHSDEITIPPSNLWAWAATGVLKQLALEQDSSMKKSILESHAICFCHLLYSRDWLEASKAQDLWHHLRRSGDPCWYQNMESPEQYREEFQDAIPDIRTVPLCIDDDAHFRNDDEGWTCGDYERDEVLEDPTVCNARDPRSNRSARHACCICGGGNGAKIITIMPPTEEKTTTTTPKKTTAASIPNEEL
jgi:hypothetical protein